MSYFLTDWFETNQQVELAQFVPGGPDWIVGLVLVYLITVLVVGPGLMRNRDPFELKSAIKVYNIVNILANSAIFYYGLRFTNYGIDSFKCSTNGDLFDRAFVYYGYFLLKVW